MFGPVVHVDEHTILKVGFPLDDDPFVRLDM